MRETPRAYGSGRWSSRFRALRNLPPLLRIVWSSSPSTVVVLILLRSVSGVIPLIILSVSKRIIDGLVAHVNAGVPLSSYFWWLVGLEFAFAGLASVLGRALDFCDALLADRFTLTISVRIMEHTSRLDLAYYEDPTFYDKLERARVQATDRVGTIQAIGRLIQEAITAVTLGCGVLFYSPLLMLILLCAIVPAFFGDSYFALRGYILAFQQTPLRRELDYLRLLAASKETAKELRLFRLGSYWTTFYKSLSRRLHRQNVQLARTRLLAGVVLSLLSTGGYYAAYTLVIYETVSGRLSVGSLTFLAGAISGASGRIQTILWTFSSIADQALFLNDLFDLLSVRPRICCKTNPIQVRKPVERGFEFRNVCFAYPGSSEVVLQGLSFCIQKGERVALVGNNGSGKSTVVKLLTRLYDPSAGQIYLDGIDLREYDLAHLHRQIAVIFQDFVRYDRTARQNISIGNIEECHTRRIIESAARKSFADEFIARLPLGYEQMLGRRFAGGVDLSGGEWQKIALARAYCKHAAQLLVLDEPTASLDPASELNLLAQFTEIAAGKMALLISHRLSTVRTADRILVLEKGKIVEEGTHSELMAYPNRYSEMFELQASSYR